MTIDVAHIAIVGTGTIGASWATQYLARGFDVVATDPAPGAEAALRAYVDAAWDTAATLGLAAGASRERLRFTADLPDAVADAGFVQENAPERPELKVKLLAEIDGAAPPDAIIASSSSAITMSEMQAECRHPERTVIGHPFNPPHLIPLVEVVGGERTAPETIARAMAFYASIGKKPVHLRKELPGHVANRLQAALYREVVHLIDQGVLGVADADDAVSWGPGLRWGVMGPSLLWHLGGGEGGIQHFMDTLMGPMAGDVGVAGQPGDDAGARAADRRRRARGGERPLGRRARRGSRRDAARPAGRAREVSGMSGRLFMLEISGGGRVVSMEPDGSDKDVLVTGCRLPDGVAVDVENGHVYWTNMGNPPADDGSIERADLDGGQRVTIVAARRHPHAEAAAARAGRSQAVLVRPGGDAGHALRPRRLERRDACADGRRRRRPARRDALVRGRRRRRRRRAALLDAEGPERRGAREDPARRDRTAGRRDGGDAQRRRGALRRAA